MISEELKAQYDIIAERKNGKVIVVHKPINSDIKGVYDSYYDLSEEATVKGLTVQIFEAING